MKDKKIARLIAAQVYTVPMTDEERALKAFVERMVIPGSVTEYTFPSLESYIRDALKRGTDHWDICSPADTQVDTFADSEPLPMDGYVVTISDPIWVGNCKGSKTLKEDAE